jgi:hypothetical protein
MSLLGGTIIQGFFAHGASHLAARFGVPAMAQPKCATPVCPQRRVPQPVQRLSPIQRHAAVNGSAFQLPEHLAGLTQVGGQPLPPEVRQKMESFFGASFADVRVHVGPHASAIGALAFTQGAHIHFAPGQYNPSSPQGQQILGHELTHVVQQRAGRVRNPFGSGVAVVQDVGLEAEAERLGRRAAGGVSPVRAFFSPVPRPQPISALQPMMHAERSKTAAGIGVAQLKCSQCGFEKGHAANCTPESRAAAAAARKNANAIAVDQSNDSRSRRGQRHPHHGNKNVKKAWKGN